MLVVAAKGSTEFLKIYNLKEDMALQSPLFKRIVELGKPVVGFTIVPGLLHPKSCLLYTSPSPRDATLSRMPSSA